MTFGDANDPLLRALARLPDATPDGARAARTRARCHAALERGSGVRLGSDPEPQGSDPSLTPLAALVGGLCLLYLSTVILEAVRLRVL